MAKLIYNPDELPWSEEDEEEETEEETDYSGVEAPMAYAGTDLDLLRQSPAIPFDWSRLIIYTTLGGIAGYALCELYSNVQDMREIKLAEKQSREPVPYIRPHIPCTAVGAGIGVFASLMQTISERQLAVLNVVMADREKVA